MCRVRDIHTPKDATVHANNSQQTHDRRGRCFLREVRGMKLLHDASSGVLDPTHVDELIDHIPDMCKDFVLKFIR